MLFPPTPGLATLVGTFGVQIKPWPPPADNRGQGRIGQAGAVVAAAIGEA